MAPEVAGA